MVYTAILFWLSEISIPHTEVGVGGGPGCSQNLFRAWDSGVSGLESRVSLSFSRRLGAIALKLC